MIVGSLFTSGRYRLTSSASVRKSRALHADTSALRLCLLQVAACCKLPSRNLQACFAVRLRIRDFAAPVFEIVCLCSRDHVVVSGVLERVLPMSHTDCLFCDLPDGLLPFSFASDVINHTQKGERDCGFEYHTAELCELSVHIITTYEYVC